MKTIDSYYWFALHWLQWILILPSIERSFSSLSAHVYFSHNQFFIHQIIVSYHATIKITQDSSLMLWRHIFRNAELRSNFCMMRILEFCIAYNLTQSIMIMCTHWWIFVKLYLRHDQNKMTITQWQYSIRNVVEQKKI